MCISKHDWFNGHVFLHHMSYDILSDVLCHCFSIYVALLMRIIGLSNTHLMTHMVTHVLRDGIMGLILFGMRLTCDIFVINYISVTSLFFLDDTI